mmetsp:Transcript_41542/g.105252  ORF Transcript_41542/g.105252 Transcript_41542/m.105252 type:complete len:335 (+) Transcript_41542:267-1271(+)
MVGAQRSPARGRVGQQPVDQCASCRDVGARTPHRQRRSGERQRRRSARGRRTGRRGHQPARARLPWVKLPGGWRSVPGRRPCSARRHRRRPAASAGCGARGCRRRWTLDRLPRGVRRQQRYLRAGGRRAVRGRSHPARLRRRGHRRRAAGPAGRTQRAGGGSLERARRGGHVAGGGRGRPPAAERLGGQHRQAVGPAPSGPPRQQGPANVDAGADAEPNDAPPVALRVPASRAAHARLPGTLLRGGAGGRPAAAGPLWRRLSRGAAPRSRQGTAARVGHQRDRAATQQPAAAGGHGGRADPDLCVAPPRAHLPPHPSCQLPKLQNTSAAWMGAA